MRVTLRERIALAVCGVVIFAGTAVQFPRHAVAMSVQEHDRDSAAALPSAPIDRKTSTTTSRAKRANGIEDPFSLPAIALATYGSAPGKEGVVGTDVPSNPFGFDTSHVPRMSGAGGGPGVPTSVYAIGTDYVMLQPGGAVLGVGSDIGGGVKIVGIDPNGVRLSNGTTLTTQPAAASSWASPTPSAAPTPTPLPTPVSTPTSSTSTSSVASPAAPPANMQQLLIDQRIRALQSPQPSSSGGP